MELGQGRLDPPGPWPRIRGEGQRRGVLGPPLDVKALKGPGSSAPCSGPASLLPRSQSTFTLDARPSQLLQMFPGPELSLHRRRAPLPPQREGLPLPPQRNTLRRLGRVGPGKPPQSQGTGPQSWPSWDEIGGIYSTENLSRHAWTHRHVRLLL